MDLKIYNISAADEAGDVLESSALSAAPAADLEVLANKVVKYLLTGKGSCILSPEYGCFLTDYRSNALANKARFKLEALTAVANCASFIKSKETEHTEAVLSSLTLEKIDFGSDKLRGRVDLYIKITAADGSQAMLDFPVETN